MHGLTGGDWKRGRYLRKPRQSPTLPLMLGGRKPQRHVVRRATTGLGARGQTMIAGLSV